MQREDAERAAAEADGYPEEVDINEDMGEDMEDEGEMQYDPREAEAQYLAMQEQMMMHQQMEGAGADVDIAADDFRQGQEEDGEVPMQAQD